MNGAQQECVELRSVRRLLTATVVLLVAVLAALLVFGVLILQGLSRLGPGFHHAA